MKHTMALVWLLVVVPLACGAQTFNPSIPEECRCGLARSKPACQAGWANDTDVVFVGKVSSVSRSRGDRTGSLDLIEMRVVEVFRGKVGLSVTVYFHNRRCSPYAIVNPFREDQTYVVYGSAREELSGVYVTGCNRVRVIADAAEDLQYWRNTNKAPKSSTIFGTVLSYVKSKPADLHQLDEELLYEIQPLSGKDVIAEGAAGRFRAKTDANGRYEITGLAPGDYTVYVVGPPRKEVERVLRFPQKASVAVVAKGCAEADFREEAWEKGIYAKEIGVKPAPPPAPVSVPK